MLKIILHVVSAKISCKPNFVNTSVRQICLLFGYTHLLLMRFNRFHRVQNKTEV